MKNKLLAILTLATFLNIAARNENERGKFSSGLHSGYSGEDSSNNRGLRGFAGTLTGATVAVPATVVGADTRYNKKSQKKQSKSKTKKSKKRNNSEENFNQ